MIKQPNTSTAWRLHFRTGWSKDTAYLLVHDELVGKEIDIALVIVCIEEIQDAEV